jgi:diguanylate cyclase (GGDEF)-like protein
MPAAITSRRLLLLAGAAFAVGGAAYLWTPAGAGYVFCVGVALAALAAGARAGVAAALLAALLATVGDASDASVTATRAAAFVATGAVVGWLGGRHRELVRGLRELADTDHLTGLLNSRAFERELADRCEGARRFALLVGDVDGLKRVNDRDGHAAGNVLLRRVATALPDTLREDDVCARIGGDEFGLLVAATDERDAAALAARLERQLARRGTPVSFGWALFPGSGRTPEALFDAADVRLYSTKRASTRASAG